MEGHQTPSGVGAGPPALPGRLRRRRGRPHCACEQSAAWSQKRSRTWPHTGAMCVLVQVEDAKAVLQGPFWMLRKSCVSAAAGGGGGCVCVVMFGPQAVAEGGKCC